ncbi:hypothetical protein SEVIR_2G436100v4 [Setaria viridis]|uniref:F-box domain-containing protein n=1 Tax=Setaria viridis TaxID=4556 RepID=A0A4U6W1R0_SETVI|nr:putative F-box protein At5g62660 [Setaria viridis]TKW36370.1 hypothetical protein SEVIR_2G436100v2 [Setaria viridis]
MRMEDTPIRRLPEDTIADILLRLPAKSILRSGATCKAWRRITTAQHFLVARARRRQPASILAHTYLDAAPWACSSDLLAGFSSEDVALDALPVSSPEDDRQRLLRYPATRLTVPAHCGRLLASSDGVLLFKKDMGFYLLCNPITRQWAELPRLPNEYCKGKFYINSDPEYGFYFHQPSGEFRLLCCSLTRGFWYIVSTGAGEPRHLKLKQEPDLITRFIRPLLTTATMPVALDGKLHWPPIWRCATGKTRITAFDTVSEMFCQMPGPTSRTPKMMKLFEMEGMLAAADFGEEKHVDLWFLEDYSSQRWVHRQRVASPWKYGSGGRPRNDWGMQSVAVAGDDEGNIILGNNDGLVVYDVRKGEMVRTVNSVMQRKNRVFVSKHVFKGSTVQHTCFFTPSSADSPLIHSWS